MVLALPPLVRGPVLFFAFLRLAATFLADVIFQGSRISGFRDLRLAGLRLLASSD